jgi:hypothetical protein
LPLVRMLLIGGRHCEERGDEAIQAVLAEILDCFASLAMTGVPQNVSAETTRTF